MRRLPRQRRLWEVGEVWEAEKEREHTRVRDCVCKAKAVWGGG